MTAEDCQPESRETGGLSKLELRRLALDRRAAVRDKDGLSRAITARLLNLPEYAAAGLVLWYVHARSEVRTLARLAELLGAGAQFGTQIAVPFCEQSELRLFRLANVHELVAGAYGILEPAAELRHLPERHVEPSAIDLAIVPGVAFDRLGTRLGYGAGYYDKLLPHLRAGVPRIALAFECQVFARLPRDAHDAPLTAIVTERAVYRC
jgi:5-formyltetrahydrofolate cyclo-ligase